MADILNETQSMSALFDLFLKQQPIEYEIKNTSRGDKDFREAIIIKCSLGEKYVIKLADNDFTYPSKIAEWKKCSEEYRRLSYYCPAIIPAKSGGYPIIEYKGHHCVAYMEEYSKYKSADDFDSKLISMNTIMNDAFVMTAKVAAKKWDFSDSPSGYCLFDRFSPSDTSDEVTENASEWLSYAKTLPEQFQEKVQQIWCRWQNNRSTLEKIYNLLPTSVFQADLNKTNILLDDSGQFVGVFDFNLCGKDVFLNYLFREIYSDDDRQVIDKICLTLKNVSKYYVFSENEMRAALPLYRCIKPLWFTKVQELKEAGNNIELIKKCLDEIEYMQTENIDFISYMI